MNWVSVTGGCRRWSCCGKIVVSCLFFCLLTSGYLSTVISLTPPCSRLFHCFVFCLQQEGYERTKRAVSCVHEPHWWKWNVLDFCSLSMTVAVSGSGLGVLFCCCGWCTKPKEDTISKQHIRTGGRIHELCKGTKSGVFVLLWTVSGSNCSLNCF